MTLLLCLALGLSPQSGVLPEWESRKLAGKVTADLSRIQPMLEQVDPDKWQDREGAAVYAPYLAGVRTSAAAVETAATGFAQQPERLTTALDFLFHLDTLTMQAGLLSQGIRRYQNPAVADLFDAAVRDAAAGRDALRQHVHDLAGLREKELEVADKEAQRCRAQLARPPSPSKPPTARK